MGAICGLVVEGSIESSHSLVKVMLDRISSRGPDAQWTYADEIIALGCFYHEKECTFEHEQVACVGIEGRLYVLLDGRISNHRELTQKYNLAETISSENLVAHIYLADGLDGFSRICGAFAIAIWDAGERILILARDMTGQKPLYYFRKGNYLAFASHLDALTALPHFHKEISPLALQLYLGQGYISSPHTIFQNAFKLEEGFALLWNRTSSRFRIVRYGDIYPPPEKFDEEHQSPASEEELVDELEKLIMKAVEHSIQDLTKPAIFLSGGIDTSLLAAVASKMSPQRPSTFCVGFADSAFDERPYARRIARVLKTDHHECEVNANDFRIATFESPRFFGEPYADPGLAPNWCGAKMVKKYSSVAISGDGADFIFGNYDLRYMYYYYLLPYPLRKLARLFLDPICSTDLISRKLPNINVKGMISHRKFLHILNLTWSPVRVAELLNVQPSFPSCKAIRIFQRYRRAHISERMLAVQLFNYGIESVQVKMERLTMGHSVAVRCPYWDLDVVNFALSLPLSLRFRRGYGKYLLKNLLFRYLPERLFQRPKRGFSLPFDQHVLREMEDLIKIYLSPKRLEREGIFNPNCVKREIASFKNGNMFSGKRLWTLLVFEVWRETYNV
jgi:asparagine synthase (glutamine-hydrolysing)